MRKCIRCNVEMIDDLEIKVEGAGYGIRVTTQGFLRDNIGKLKCAVCPECGYTEAYIQNTETIKKYTK